MPFNFDAKHYIYFKQRVIKCKTLKYYFHSLFATSKNTGLDTIRTKNIMDSFYFLVEKLKHHDRFFSYVSAMANS